MSYNKTIFQGVPKKQVNKSRFNLSHEYKAGLTMGRLIPILTLETLPGDEFNIDTEFMFRFAPMYFPIMHKVTMRADYFFIPNRILWIQTDQTSADGMGWAKWIANEEGSTDVEHPWVSSEQANDLDKIQNVLTYMGVPVGTEDPGNTTTVITHLNALPLSAYLKIWDEYYRIPQLEDEKWFPLQTTDNSVAFTAAFGNAALDIAYKPLSAKWEKDYFTSALPTPQIGDAIQIPMIGEDGILPSRWLGPGGFSDPPMVGDPGASGTLSAGLVGASQGETVAASTGWSGLDVQDTAATIKQLRIAEVLQSYYERIMKVGQRYRDFIEGLWGNDPQPGDVDVPVLLGSKFGRVQISDVMTQALTGTAEAPISQTGDYTGQANLYSNDGGNINYRCNEHGWIICIFQMNPNTSYGQGIERFWRRSIQTDYPLDMFAGIGDQEILKEEIMWPYVNTIATRGEETFGYIPRFSEMRFKNNLTIGTLNFNYGKSTQLGRLFNEQTAGSYDDLEISAAFTESSAANIEFGGTRLVDNFRTLPIGPLVTQEASEPIVFGHIFHSIYVNRALPMFSTPKSI